MYTKIKNITIGFVFGLVLCSTFYVSFLKAEGNKQVITKKSFLEGKAYVGPKEYFTGKVTVSPLFPPNKDINAAGAYVTFAPKARSAWHTHAAGQWLVVTAGEGLTQYENGKVEKFKAGDVIWCSPNVKHWHGATATSSMTHIAITGVDKKGNMVVWGNHVSDSEYKK